MVPKLLAKTERLYIDTYTNMYTNTNMNTDSHLFGSFNSPSISSAVT